MEFDKVVLDRRSIRSYADRDVDDELISRILESARLCQSAKNRQIWRFLILRGAEKDHVADIMLNPDATNVDMEGPYRNSSANSARIIKNAPVLILVFMDSDDDWAYTDMLSMGAAIEHMCLEAVNLGLGALWIRDTVYTEDDICKYVGYENLYLVSGVALGYAAEAPGPRPRKSIEEITLNFR